MTQLIGPRESSGMSQMNSELHDTDNRNHTSLQPSTVIPPSNSMAAGPGRQRSVMHIDPQIKAYIDELI
ncbi:6901_t:CDS:2 [Cetraspora pellucida]|uniref:6901_t:CDS:1 n=1 Tax=Cetraspora pellucida TaxID=1433469 RepID=A0ACA9L6D5_9GLOM|nr:6901_t:CDS:2 [Cetraspora pellucida]